MIYFNPIGGFILVDENTTIAELVGNKEAQKVFFKYGMMCLGCMAARGETLAQGAAVHRVDVKTLINEINAATEV